MDGKGFDRQIAQLPVSIVTTYTIFWQVLWFSQARNLTERPIFDSRILSEYILFTNYFFDKLNKHQLFRLQFCCKYANIKYWKFRAKLEWGLIGQIWRFSVFLLVQLRAPPVYILISWPGQPLQSYSGLYCKFTITKAAEECDCGAFKNIINLQSVWWSKKREVSSI